MKKLLKALIAITLTTAVIFTIGCNPEDDPINGGGDNGGNGNTGGDPNNHVYVDLGLPSGTLWATCNVGANAPEECGYYFAWGEIESKDSYNWSNYKYCYQVSTALTKYCFNANIGLNHFTDNLTALESGDDAATVNWGDDWRTPTEIEFQELEQNTTRLWTIQNGMAGYLLTAANGNTLFLPAAGYGAEQQNYLYVYGQYWTENLSEISAAKARCYIIEGNGNFYPLAHERFYGHSVRPVRSMQK